MKIKIIDFGLPENHRPLRSHANDAGADVYMKRNRNMVSQADRVIAVYDGREKGGTVSTIRMVHAQRKEMREVPVQCRQLKANPTRKQKIFLKFTIKHLTKVSKKCYAAIDYKH